MAHPFRHFRVLLCMLLAAALCAACAAEVGEALPLETYQDPGGRFTLSIPKGWQAESAPDGSLLTLTPPDYAGAETELRVLVYISPTNTLDTSEHVEEATALFQPFLEKYLDDSYEVINQGETKVDKVPAFLIDYAKPYEQTYLTGRLVMVAVPGYALAFLGSAERSDWESFLPTFRALLADFHLLLIPESTPLP
ncbi:MAG: PsbP-related protein [Anaerolineaceae bacterium]